MNTARMSYTGARVLIAVVLSYRCAVMMASLHIKNIFLLFLVTTPGIFGSPYSYRDLTPSMNDEVNDLLSALLEEPQQRQSQFTDQDWNGGAPWPHAEEVKGWSRASPRLGQISGATVDRQGRPVIFHRGPVSWIASSFNSSDHYQLSSQGAIPVDTILTLHPLTGSVLEGWGRNLFYLPHGITICPRTGDTWLTDVALHQAFKFRVGETESPAVTLGQRFEPGSDMKHFCKPTSIAISSEGSVFIADGYCNQRVLHFDTEGNFIAELGQNLGPLSFTLPHGIALMEERDALCVADREARRVTCIKAGLQEPDNRGNLIGSFQDKRIGPIYDIAIAGGMLYAVAEAAPGIPATGFTIDPSTGAIIDTWAPQTGFHAPHDVAVTLDGSTIYVGEIGPNRVTKFVLAP